MTPTLQDVAGLLIDNECIVTRGGLYDKDDNNSWLIFHEELKYIKFIVKNLWLVISIGICLRDFIKI